MAILARMNRENAVFFLPALAFLIEGRVSREVVEGCDHLLLRVQLIHLTWAVLLLSAFPPYLELCRLVNDCDANLENTHVDGHFVLFLALSGDAFEYRH